MLNRRSGIVFGLVLPVTLVLNPCRGLVVVGQVVGHEVGKVFESAIVEGGGVVEVMLPQAVGHCGSLFRGVRFPVGVLSEAISRPAALAAGRSVVRPR
jgi:hypothetical protein